MKKVAPTLRRITKKLNGHFSFMDDEDLYQEALIHLWVNWNKGSLEDKTDSYILQGCYFHLRNHVRKVQDKAILQSFPSMNDEEMADLELNMNPRVDSFDDVEQRLQIEALRQNGMGAREELVLGLCLQGLTTREIGDRMGVSHVSIIKIRNRIRERYSRLNGIDNSFGKGRNV